MTQEAVGGADTARRATGFAARLKKLHWTSWLGVCLVLLLVAFTVVGASVSPYAPEQVSFGERLQPPSAQHWFGTDQFGRDVLSRVLAGAKISLLVGFAATLIGVISGVVIGCLAGFIGGWLDELLMRCMDVMLAFPYIVLAILFMSIAGSGIASVVIVIALTRLPEFARVSRGLVLALKENVYVSSAEAIGASRGRILARHILPNGLGSLIVLTTLNLATIIRMEATLSFLGLGIPPPDPTWGGMISDGRRFILGAPWITTFPGLVLSLTILGFNLLSDGLRGLFDPVSSRKRK